MIWSIWQHRGSGWLLTWALLVLVPFVSAMCVGECHDDPDDAEL
jgi:hypothetical protein